MLLKRICFNLIGNALKYNKENGCLRVSCNEISFDGESGEYEFVCADSGIGMSEEFQKRMYEPFAQEDPSFKNSYGGSGLGLAIVKKLVDALDGTIDVQSTRGVGTTFTVRLRFKTDKEAANGNADTAKEIVSATEKAAGAAQDKKPLAGVKILLTEDNELNLEIARFMLTTGGRAGRRSVQRQGRAGYISRFGRRALRRIADGCDDARDGRNYGNETYSCF